MKATKIINAPHYLFTCDSLGSTPVAVARFLGNYGISTPYRFDNYLRILLTAIFLIGLTAIKSIALNISPGLAIGSRMHYSKSSLQLTPGPSLCISSRISPDIEIDSRFHAGSLFGYDLTTSITGRYIFQVMNWHPALGLQLSCSGGHIITHRSGPDYFLPSSPEWGISLEMLPVSVSTERVTVSFLECAIGTDLRHFGRVLLVDATLLQININFNKR